MSANGDLDTHHARLRPRLRACGVRPLGVPNENATESWQQAHFRAWMGNLSHMHSGQSVDVQWTLQWTSKNSGDGGEGATVGVKSEWGDILHNLATQI